MRKRQVNPNLAEAVKAAMRREGWQNPNQMALATGLTARAAYDLEQGIAPGPKNLQRLARSLGDPLAKWVLLAAGISPKQSDVVAEEITAYRTRRRRDLSETAAAIERILAECESATAEAMSKIRAELKRLQED